MKPRDLFKDAIRLRDEWRRQITQLTAKSRNAPAADRRLIEMHARVLGACSQDLDDVITAKEHPSGRRG
ncbi:hypothetical protein [Pseudoxanthomonas sp. UTMC 1351]|uniref:hypothetical protein n=1 Tax=Pseudoxanthomonas sp. UTMC 1351 TaxID=2695853 RepID=UPI0034CF12A7